MRICAPKHFHHQGGEKVIDRSCHINIKYDFNYKSNKIKGQMVLACSTIHTTADKKFIRLLARSAKVVKKNTMYQM